MTTLLSACGSANRHIEIHENYLEGSGVITSKSDQLNTTKFIE